MTQKSVGPKQFKVRIKESYVAPGSNPQGKSESVADLANVEVTYLDAESTPRIPYNLGIDEFAKFFTIEEFASLYTIEIGLDSVSIVLLNGEEGLNKVKIPYRLIAPEHNDLRFPKFILNVSDLSSGRFDYSNGFLIFNQNELLWLTLYHRLQQFSGYKRSYTYLLSKDIQAILNYADYNIYNSYNAIQKAKNSYAVLNVFDKFSSGQEDDDPYLGNTFTKVFKTPIGENIRTPKLTAKSIQNLFRDLAVLPSSESMASETGKFVINDKDEIYHAAGFKLDPVRREIQTIFAVKPNIPARFKSHISSDAFRAEKYDYPIFEEDVLEDYDEKTDQTLINAVVVFHELEENGRFLCGEIECSDRFAQNTVVKREIIRGQFSMLAVQEGTEVRKSGGRYIIGIDENFNEVAVYGFDSVKILSVESIGLQGNYKVVAECIKKIGSSRIISSTGIKGVTKPGFDLGSIFTKTASGDQIEIPVDLIAGANSLKAKANTIFLAQAALAHQLGYSNKNLISSLNVDEINDLKGKVGKVKFVDRLGNESEVYAGIVPIRVTEMAYMYKNARDQSFMTQSGWHLYQNGHRELAEYIYNRHVSDENRKLIAELTKIIYDDCAKFAPQDALPVYSLYDIGRYFDLNDVKLDTNPMVPHISRLLVDENKGFYIYIHHKDEYVRMPSAALINRFVSKLADGTYIYPRLLTIVSQILEMCLKKNEETGQINIGYIMRKNETRFTKSIALVNKYIDHCMGILHDRNNLLQNLAVPKVFGCSMKQMVDINVPYGVAVVLDRHLFEKLGKNTEGYLDTHNEFYALAIRNPVLWKAQVQPIKVWDFETFRAYLNAFTKENPDKYFNEKFCKDLLLLNPEDAIIQQSDVDGDLMPIFVPHGYEAQDMIKSMIKDTDLIDDIKENAFARQINGVEGITDFELNWIKAYRDGEMDSNSVFDLDGKAYELYSIKLRAKDTNERCFSKYFADSIVAKGDVGIGTSNLWALQALLDIYRNLCDEGKIRNSRGELVQFSQQDYDLISYAYSRLLQDMVIRGIKHVEGGSAGFKPFLLKNIIVRENRPFTYKTFKETLGLGKEATDKLFEILSWGDSNGYIEQISAFISFYNRGNVDKYVVTEEFEQHMLNTFYGSRLRMFFDIRRQVIDAKASGYHYVGSTGDAKPVTTGGVTTYKVKPKFIKGPK